MRNQVCLLMILLMAPRWAGLSQIPSYSLTIQSEPFADVEFHIGSDVYHTPVSITLDPGNYTIQMPSNWRDQDKSYHFVRWVDGLTNSTRTVNLQENMTLLAHYELTYHRLAVNSDPQGIQFYLDGVNETSPWADTLLEGDHIIEMPSSVTIGGWTYYFSNWDDSSTNPMRTLDLSTDRGISATYLLRQVVNVTGSQTIHVVLVNFPDVRGSTNKDAIQKELGVVESYFVYTSYGQLDIRFDICPSWFTLEKPMSYYGAGNFSNENRSDLVNDSLQAASSSFDLASSKRVLIVHAGGDQSDSHNQDDIWSFALSPAIYSISGASVRLFVAVVSEEDPVGPVAHEIGHTLGLPDLYNVTINTTGGLDNFVGPWDLMSQGAWNPNSTGNSPSHLSSWSMMYLGWMPKDEVTYVRLNEERTLVLDPIERASSVPHTVVISFGPALFYLVEARSDPNLPQQGVIVYNVNNASTPPRVMVEETNTSIHSPWGAAFQFSLGGVPVFIDQVHDLAIIVLDNASDQYRILISSAVRGRDALEAAKSIYSLTGSIQSSERATGLTFVMTTNDLRSASMSYHFADFNEAELLAGRGQMILQSELKNGSDRLISGAKSELNETMAEAILFGLISPDVGASRTILLNAEQSYDQGNYILAIQLVTTRFEPVIQQARSQYGEELRNITTGETLIIIAVGISVLCLMVRRWRSES